MNSMSDSEINEALEETLPEGWIPVAEVQKPFLGIGSGTLKDVYYWNTVTDEVTWLHPKNRPEADLEHARTLARDMRAAQAAAVCAIAAATRYTAVHVISTSPWHPSSSQHGATRAQVLATVLRSRPVPAVAVGALVHATRRLVRPRPGGVRKAEDRRVVKAARIGDGTDLIRTVVAAQCGGGKSCCDGSGVGT